MSEFCGCCDKFVLTNGEPEDCEVTWEPTLWATAEDFASYGSMRARVSSSVSILYRFCYVLHFKHFIIYVCFL
jgi:hypothetical protein